VDSRFSHFRLFDSYPKPNVSLSSNYTMRLRIVDRYWRGYRWPDLCSKVYAIIPFSLQFCLKFILIDIYIYIYIYIYIIYNIYLYFHSICFSFYFHFYGTHLYFCRIYCTRILLRYCVIGVHANAFYADILHTHTHTYLHTRTQKLLALDLECIWFLFFFYVHTYRSCRRRSQR